MAANYTALIAAWNSATTPPAGVTGTSLSGLTTEQKLIAINGWTLSGAVPASFALTGNQLINCIRYAEFAQLTATQQANILALCGAPGSLLGGSTNVGLLPEGMFKDYFPAGGPTLSAIIALARGTVQFWWGASVANGGAGLTAPITNDDLIAAGNLT